MSAKGFQPIQVIRGEGRVGGREEIQTHLYGGLSEAPQTIKVTSPLHQV